MIELRVHWLRAAQWLAVAALLLVASGFVPRTTWEQGDVVVALCGLSIWVALLALAATRPTASRAFRRLAGGLNAVIASLGLAGALLALLSTPTQQVAWIAPLLACVVIPALIGALTALAHDTPPLINASIRSL